MVDIKNLMVVSFFTIIISFIDTLSYSIRPSGVRIYKIAVEAHHHYL
ncbi:MAG: DUF2837 family protein [Thermoanaerobacteraceae bacterium]|nr:DUF2837 family protein [Thermoanaerobacteraceae bacterium]